jgi:hypothetical protein
MKPKSKYFTREDKQSKPENLNQEYGSENPEKLRESRVIIWKR